VSVTWGADDFERQPASSRAADVDMTSALRYAEWTILLGEGAMSLNLSSVGWRSEPSSFGYDWKDVVLYALGIGATVDELDYLFEGRGPKVYPTFAVVPAIGHVFRCLNAAQIPLDTVVHGAQVVRAFAAPPPKATLTTFGEIIGIYDMKKFAALSVRTESSVVDGPKVFETEWSIIVRGGGGFGGPHPPKEEDCSIPAERAPDFRHEQQTVAEQALLYRLNGDINPLHANPEVAKAAGFDRPILHGLATFGFACRAISLHACQGDASRLESIRGQFRRPVLPGDTLVTEGWRDGSRVVYRVSVKERDEVVVANAAATLRA
jgi:acyl dehydratase